MAATGSKTAAGGGDGGIQAIARAFAVLRAIADSGSGVKLGELSKRVDLPRPTVHRIVTSLQAEGAIYLTLDGRVRTGPELTRLASTAETTLIDAARPFMERLSQEIDEKIDLAVLDREHIRFVAQVMPRTTRLLAGVTVGDLFPTYCTAPGKVLLAQLGPRALRLALPKRLAKCTDRTITSVAALEAELEEVRAGGLGFDREEHSESICAVAALVSDALGGLAALTIAVPSERYYGREQELSEALRSTVTELNEALGAGRNME
jgi:DNA-binding IclR family transcriptional regulator